MVWGKHGRAGTELFPYTHLCLEQQWVYTVFSLPFQNYHIDLISKWIRRDHVQACTDYEEKAKFLYPERRLCGVVGSLRVRIDRDVIHRKARISVGKCVHTEV